MTRNVKATGRSPGGLEKRNRPPVKTRNVLMSSIPGPLIIAGSLMLVWWTVAASLWTCSTICRTGACGTVPRW